MSIKIKTFGWKNPPLDVLSRIESGFIENNCILTDDNPDLIYKNEDFFDQAIDYSINYPNAYKIFNILDLQIDNPTYDLKRLKNQLLKADKITCISNTTKSQIKKYLDLDSEVIYTPSKNINFLNTKKTFPFLYVGRANSVNKRFNLIRQAFDITNWPQNYITICGSENPFFGRYLGIINDEYLNIAYNNAKITLLPSITEGIGLSFIESIMAYTPVVGCSDCIAALEFLPEKMICDPTPMGLVNKIKEINDNYKYFVDLSIEYAEKYKTQFNQKTVANNIIDIYLKSKYN
jgi:glycosyltransferase involved in cell wall biosynthesis